MHSFDKDIDRLRQHYSNLIKKYGDSPKGVQWTDKKTQEKRMAVLAEVGDLRFAKVLDFGCGAGHLLEFLTTQLNFEGEYVGYDICSSMIHAAKRKFPNIRFEERNILKNHPNENFDYILANGVFNNRISDNWNFMRAILKRLFLHASKGISFNAMSTYVDHFNNGLFYVDPEKVFSFCKEELSPSVTLRHDYLVKPNVVPFEFTIFVYHSTIKPRKKID